MAFTRWDPLRDLLALEERLDRLHAPAATGWAPPVDLLEAPDRFVIVVEVPGLRREDLRIDVQENRVRISGSRQACSVPCEQFHRVERGHGGFSRSFVLPVAVDSDTVEADLKDGLLTVIAPKAGGGPRRIAVS